MSKKKDSSRFDALFGAARQKEPLDLTDSKPTKKSKSTDPDYVRTTVYLPKVLHRSLKAAAAASGKEMSEVFEQLVEQWLKSRKVDEDV
ncbi:MAG: CopG family transcriptional regulator [Nitrososphaera sp.]|nr:CopG family transcriptional regulator [Nitrososphaera sp.]